MQNSRGFRLAAAAENFQDKQVDGDRVKIFTEPGTAKTKILISATMELETISYSKSKNIRISLVKISSAGAVRNFVYFDFLTVPESTSVLQK